MKKKILLFDCVVQSNCIFILPGEKNVRLFIWTEMAFSE